MSTKQRQTIRGAKPKETEVAKAESTAVSTAVDYGDDAGGGFENVGREDMAIPFIQVLQKNSPQLNPPKQGGVEGAKAGMLLNTVTNELYDGEEGMLFVPAVTQHMHVEWKPREAGGGFVAIHEADSEAVKSKGTSFGKFRLPNGNDLVETFYLYGIIIKDGTVVGPVALPFASTKIKAYRGLITRLSTFRVDTPNGKKVPPLYAHQLRMTTFFTKNEKGDFYNVQLDSAKDNLLEGLLPPGHEAFQAAKALKESVLSGKARAAQPQADHDGDAPASSGVF